MSRDQTDFPAIFPPLGSRDGPLAAGKTRRVPGTPARKPGGPFLTRLGSFRRKFPPLFGRPGSGPLHRLGKQGGLAATVGSWPAGRVQVARLATAQCCSCLLRGRA